jgi:hypothetical protein
MLKDKFVKKEKEMQRKIVEAEAKREIACIQQKVKMQLYKLKQENDF